MVLSRAVPIDPPTCWDVLTMAEATPASAGRTPRVAVLIDGAMTAPRPTPVMTSPGEDVADVPAVQLRWANTTMPTAARARPEATTNLGPIRGSTRVWTVKAVPERQTIMGRKASPVRSACCSSALSAGSR